MPQINDFEKILLSTNLVKAKNLKDLGTKERELTSKRVFQLNINPIRGDFDYQHLKNIHNYIFKDVYTWAGKDRFDMGLNGVFLKGNQHFVPGNELPKYSKIIFDELKEQNFLKNYKDIDLFAKNITNFMMELNALHPFREGNGRTQRIFLNELAKNAGYKMDLNLISAFKMITACKLASKLKPQFLEKLIKENLKR
ncbi:MAG: Fic family protein [Sulfurimonas sp.]|nr:Fic family protein [Sulfurimonadaceae bacterium]